jgi:hypothetical protein
MGKPPLLTLHPAETILRLLDPGVPGGDGGRKSPFIMAVA